MSAFPDMLVKMDDVTTEGDQAILSLDTDRD